MKPITREEYYLAKIAGTWQGKTPEPVTIEEYYLATMAGDYSGNIPQPVTRLQYYMAKAAGVWGGSIPAPVTRLEYYWAAIAGKEGHIPDPVTRQEYLLYAISQSNNDVINTVFGATIIINDAAEGRPFRGLRVFGKSTQVRTEGKNLFDITKFMGSENVINNGDVWDVNKNHEFSITEEMVGSGYLFFYGNKDNTVVTIKDIMISKEKNAVYEPYTGGKPSPSPEYPQEMASAGEGGSIAVEVGGKNLFDADRLSNGNFVEFRGVECYKYVDTDKGFAFDFSKNNSANQLTFTIKMYRETNLNNVAGFRFEYSDGTNESHNIKHDTPKTVVTTKGKILKKITSMHAYNEVCYIDLSVTQLEYGTVPTPYEPPRIPQTLTLQT